MRASLDLIRQRDGRPPIIFLRSFQDDGNDGSPLLEKTSMRRFAPTVRLSLSVARASCVRQTPHGSTFALSAGKKLSPRLWTKAAPSSSSQA
jgi:hypothetical protein